MISAHIRKANTRQFKKSKYCLEPETNQNFQVEINTDEGVDAALTTQSNSEWR